MSKWTGETTFHCNDTCNPYAGCQGHTLKLSYHGVSDTWGIYTKWVDYDGKVYENEEHMSDGEMEAIRELLKENEEDWK